MRDHLGFRGLTDDELRSQRRIANEQLRVCLPLDRRGWLRIRNGAVTELKWRGFARAPYTVKGQPS